MLELLSCHAPRDQIATVGVIGAKKVVRFAKALIKARKDRSLGSVEDVSAIAATQGSGDEEEQEDEVRAVGQQSICVRWAWCMPTHSYGCNNMFVILPVCVRCYRWTLATLGSKPG